MGCRPLLFLAMFFMSFAEARYQEARGKRMSRAKGSNYTTEKGEAKNDLTE